MKTFKYSILICIVLGSIAGVFGVLAYFSSEVQAAPTATTHFVSHTGSGSNTCDDWANACSLQKALADAVSGDEIWIKTGVYRPGTGTNRALTFQLKSGVALYGGFAGDETNRNDRDWEANPTILDGDINNDGTLTGNAYHVVTALNLSTQATLDGLVITGGNGDATTTPQQWGGGLYALNSELLIQNVTFSKNQARGGGGMFSNGTSQPVILVNVVFSQNTATVNGGGLHTYAGSSPSLTNVVFFANHADTYGGGMYNYASSPTLTNVTLSGNSADTSGSGIYNYNGSSPTLTNAVLWGNTLDQIAGDSATVTYSDIQGGYNGLGDEEGNIDADPMFVEPASANLRLQHGSPAIDVGDNSAISGVTTDLDGSARIVSSTVDMGAYEIQASRDVIYVDRDATGANDGSSWADALINLQAGLAAATSSNQLWIADGLYKPAVPGSPPTVTFRLKSGVALYGGYPGAEAPLEDRDWAANPTILSGDIGFHWYGIDLWYDGPNASHVITAIGITETAILDGLTITGGHGQAHPTQKQGGGMYAENSNLHIQNIFFKENQAACGGGMFVKGNLQPVILENVVFHANLSPTGGGMCNDSSSPTLNNVIFSWNTATSEGGGIHNDDSNPTLSQVTFYGNYADKGGGMYNDGCNPTLTNATFFGNSADYGSGIFNYFSSPSLTNVTFSGNSAFSSGGGIINLDTSNPILTNAILWGNTPDQIYDDGTSTSTVTYSDIQGGYDGAGNEEGNIDADPMFANAASGNLRLEHGSPAINTGDNAAVPSGVTADLDGSVRIVGSTVDMGAYETQASRDFIYVDPDSTGPDHDGSSWENALINLQAALAAAIDGNEIWIAEGDFRPGIVGYRLASFQLKSGVALYGGFAGTEDELDERVWEANPTILSGDIDGDDTLEGNAYHVVTAVNLSAQATLDGLTISGGNGDAPTTPEQWGGGLYAENSNLHIQNILFTGNRAAGGGGMFTNGGSQPVTIEDVEFSQNTATVNGGGMHTFAGSNPTLTNVVFFTNHASTQGGGMYNDGSSPTFTDVNFSGNSAYYGGGMYNQNSSPALTDVDFSGNSADSGGGMSNYLGSPTLNNVTFSNNIVSMDGGGVYNHYSNPILTIVAFNDNSAQWKGGGIYNSDGNPVLTNVTFSGNSAIYGGGMYSQYGNPAITDVVFSENNATSGGGMYNIYGSLTLTDITFSTNNGEYGGGMLNHSSSPTLTNITFSSNDADYGGGMYNIYSSPTLTNVDFSGNSGYFGGGMYSHSGNPAITDVVFSDNNATSGGGMYNDFSNLTMTNITFTVNTAVSYGGGMHNHQSSPTISDVVFSDNNADYGGGMYNYASSSTLTNVTFSTNSADYGGGMYNYASSPTISNVEFNGNYATGYGGGMHITESSPTIISATFINNTANYGGGISNVYNSSLEMAQTLVFSNTASTDGGGLYNISDSAASLINVAFSGNQAGSDGGGIINKSSSLTLTHVTVAHNDAGDDGGGIYYNGSYLVSLQNSLLWGNTSPGYNTEDDQICCFAVSRSFSTIQDSEGDPSPFLDADGADNVTGTLDDDLRLTYPAPGIIDGGNDTNLPVDSYDLDGDDDLHEPLPIDLNGSPRMYADYDLDGVVDPVEDLISDGQNQVDQGAYEAQYGWYMAYGDDRLSAGREYRSGYHDPILEKTLSDTLADYNILPFQQAELSYSMAPFCTDTPAGFTLADVLVPRLDAIWEIATGELLAGNDDMVKSMDMRFNAQYPTLSNQIANTIAALGHYQTAVDAYQNLLDEYDSYQPFIEEQPDRLSYLLDVTDPQPNPYHDVQRLAGAIAKESEGGLKLAQSYYRQYTPASMDLAKETLWEARNLAADRLALLDELEEGWGEAAWENSVYATAYQALTQNISDMERVFEYLDQGKNPFGYNPGYIPFMIRYDNSADPETVWNFLNVYDAAYAGTGSYFKDAEEKYLALLAVQRDLDDDEELLGSALAELVDEYEGPLGELCGYEGEEIDLSSCNDGAIREQAIAIKNAILRLRQAEVEMENHLELVRIEQQRAAEVAGIHRATAVMYKQDGTELATLASDEANLIYCKSDTGVALDVAGEALDVFIEGNPTSILQGLFMGALKGGIQYAKNMEERRVAGEIADIDAQREEIDARQKARVEYAEAEIVDADSEALIKKYMLEYASLKLERAIAFNDLQQAMHHLNAMTSKVEYLLARWAEAKRNVSELYLDPGTRLYRDWLAEVSQDYYDSALEWAFRSSRALDYEMGEPWDGAEDIFKIVDINNLELAYTAPDTGMKDTFDDWKAPIPPEPEYDIIPISQAMGFADSWEMIAGVLTFTTAREKFNAYVSNPDNWVDLDQNGTATSLRLTFQTSIFFVEEGLNMFSTGVYNDKILRAAPVLVGNATALDGSNNDSTIRIKQLGTCFLRRKDSVIGGLDSFSAYDFEHVVKEGDSNEARLTSYRRWINDEDLDEAEIDTYGSLGLLWRSVGCTEWVLTIAKEGIDSKNSDMVFAGLDDILLNVKHRSFGLQSRPETEALASPDSLPAANPRLLAEAESAYHYYGSLFPESPAALSPLELSMYLEQSGNTVSAVIESAGLLAFPKDPLTGMGPELHGSSVDWVLNLTSDSYSSTEGVTRTLTLSTTAVLSDGLQISGIFAQSIAGLVPEILQVQGVFTLTRAIETPVAAFSADPSTGSASLEVQFTNWSQGEPTSYLWDFGDGTTSTEVEPIHIYTQPGVYTVSLYVESLFGSDTHIETDYIVVTGTEVYLPLLIR